MKKDINRKTTRRKIESAAKGMRAKSRRDAALALDSLQKRIDQMHSMAEEIRVEWEKTYGEDGERKHTPEGQVSGFGKMVGNLGEVAQRGGDTLDDAAIPMTKRILKKTRGLVELAVELKGQTAELTTSLAQKGCDGINKFKIQSRYVMLERTTSFAARLRQMANQKFGKFVEKKTLDDLLDRHINEMFEKVSAKVDSIPTTHQSELTVNGKTLAQFLEDLASSTND